MQRPDVVWLASFPKSGNTWLRILLANFRSGLDRPVDINTELESGLLFRLRGVFDEQTMLESALLQHDEIDLLLPAVYTSMTRDLRERLYVKTHDAFVRNDYGESLHGACKAAIYIVRDPRDVAVSLAYHGNCSLERAIRALNSHTSAVSGGTGKMYPQLRQRMLSWSSHVASWQQQHEIPVHLIRYEDLKRDTEGVLRGILEFLGEKPSAQAIARAVRFSNFEELQRQERQSGFKENRVAAHPFFRRGEVGGWQQALTPEQVESIENAHGTTMRRFGYEFVPEHSPLRQSSNELSPK